MLNHINKLNVYRETGTEYHCYCPICNSRNLKVNKDTGKWSNFLL